MVSAHIFAHMEAGRIVLVDFVQLGGFSSGRGGGGENSQIKATS